MARGRRAAENDYDDMFIIPHQLEENHWYLSQAEQRVRTVIHPREAEQSRGEKVSWERSIKAVSRKKSWDAKKAAVKVYVSVDVREEAMKPSNILTSYFRKWRASVSS